MPDREKHITLNKLVTSQTNTNFPGVLALTVGFTEKFGRGPGARDDVGTI